MTLFKNSYLAITVIIFLTDAVSNFSIAEPYISASLGWTFNQKLSGIKGDENLNYPGEFQATNSGDDGFYTKTKYSDIKLKDVLQGGIKVGYYSETRPSIGIELEGNYSQPNMKRQNVTISNSKFNDVAWLGQPYGIEDQLPAKVQLLQFNLNGLYRYQGFKNFTPYIGGGPSLNIIKITGTGYSGIFVDPAIGDNGDPASPKINTTSANIGANFKLGVEYRFDKDWGLGAEYHYNWVPVDIKHFRSANNLNADLNMQSLSFVLTRHF